MYETNDFTIKNRYTDLMDGIKTLNQALYESNTYRIPKSKIRQLCHHILFRSKIQQEKTAEQKRIVSSYFSKDRIAVYTCIIGDYDFIYEPMFVPDNCDFYMITDGEVPADSKWIKMDPFQNPEVNKEWTPTLINRFYKFMPHKIFPQYRYSFYVDGCFKICTDVTEHINRLNPYGMAFFSHPDRNCVYDEINECIRLKKGISADSLNKYRDFLLRNNMPHNYGLLGCGIIARDHHNIKNHEIMEQWWQHFFDSPQRDQVVLPYVLFQNGIHPEELATLGSNYHHEYSMIHYRHKNKCH